MANKIVRSGKYDGMTFMEVASLDPDYLLNLESSGVDVPDAALAKAVRMLERDDSWDYEQTHDEQQLLWSMSLQMDEYGAYD